MAICKHKSVEIIDQYYEEEKLYINMHCNDCGQDLRANDCHVIRHESEYQSDNVTTREIKMVPLKEI